VRRDGVWSEQEAAALVPGDIIRVAPRDAVPADAILLVVVDTGYSPQPIRIDQSALTGDLVPAARLPGDDVYAGSACADGETEAVVIASGAQTNLQQAVLLADATIANLFAWILVPVWNVCLVTVCFYFLADVVAGNFGTEIVAMVTIACFLALMACICMLPQLLEPMPFVDQQRPERNTEELMRRLEMLWKNGSISEETLRRCHDLFGVEPVSDELLATLADHFGW
jgi:magnesium-transporting ATPase (P-type)